MIRDAEAPDVEMQAILALCHHSPLAPECPSCVFRSAAAVEHLTALIAGCVKSLDGAP